MNKPKPNKEEPKTCGCKCHREPMNRPLHIHSCSDCYDFKPQQPSEWEERFDERFTDNSVFWAELDTEYHLGDVDVKPFKAFIRQLLSDAKEEERTRLIEEFEKIIGEEPECILPRTADNVDQYRKTAIKSNLRANQRKALEKLKERVCH